MNEITAIVAMFVVFMVVLVGGFIFWYSPTMDDIRANRPYEPLKKICIQQDSDFLVIYGENNSRTNTCYNNFRTTFHDGTEEKIQWIGGIMCVQPCCDIYTNISKLSTCEEAGGS